MKNINKNLKYIIFVGLLLVGVVGIVALSGCINKCGDLDQNCCEKDKCNSGDLVCGDNKCVYCGGVYESCYKDNKCDNGVCSNGKCEKCGKIEELCCSGGICNSGICSKGRCEKCGKIEELCCSGGVCNSGICSKGRCEKCGNAGELCCSGGVCNTGVCSNGKCEKCGMVGELCCSGGVCNTGVCSNGKCTAKTTTQTTLPVKPIKIECEKVDDYSVGDPNIFRTSASNSKVLGQFGCECKSPYNSKSGYAKYNVQISDTGNWSIDIRYSCNNAHSVPIEIYIDDEQKPRAKFYPKNTYDWNSFKDSGKIDIGSITAGSHFITFKTEGARYGVADMDYFVLQVKETSISEISTTSSGGSSYSSEQSQQQSVPVYRTSTTSSGGSSYSSKQSQEQSTSYTIPITSSDKFLLIRECEDVDAYTVGDPTTTRPGASKQKVLGQFGCYGYAPYSPKPGYAKYNVKIPEAGIWNISIRYSCNNFPSVPIEIYVDDEQKPRAKFYTENTYDWNSFKETGIINLGLITDGSHSITFKTGGAMYGVADLDYFVLYFGELPIPSNTSSTRCNYYCYTCDNCKSKINSAGAGETICLNWNIRNHVGTCINNPLNFSNKIFDCRGHTIQGNSSGDGIYLNGKSNNTIRNCIITNFTTGINFQYVNSSIIENNTISHIIDYGIVLHLYSNNIVVRNNNISQSRVGIVPSGGNGHDWSENVNSSYIIENNIIRDVVQGIHLYDSTRYNLITNNSVFNAASSCFSSDRGFESRFENNTCENSYIGINLVLYAKDNYFKNNDIRNSSIGIRFEHWGSDNNNVFKNMNLSNSSLYAVYFESGSGSLNNTFINVTYNPDKERMNSSSELIRKWYLDVNVEDINGVPFNNANVSTYNVSGDIQFSVLTNALGNIERQEVIEYINNAGVRNFYTNYTINITKTGYSNYSAIMNISNNAALFVILSKTLNDSELIENMMNNTWNYLKNFNENNLPLNWYDSVTNETGKYFNPAELGFYALSPILAYEMELDCDGDGAFEPKNSSGENDWNCTIDRVNKTLNSLNALPKWKYITKEIWKLGDNECPPICNETTFDEFDQSYFDSHFYVGIDSVSEFPKEINDNLLTQIYIHYNLTAEESEENLSLFLDTMWANYNLRIKVGQNESSLVKLGEYMFHSYNDSYPEERFITINKGYLAEGENIILLENANNGSDHWMSWDSLKLGVYNETGVYYQRYSTNYEVTGRLVPSIDNAWLAVSIITIREYAEANNLTSLADKAESILSGMNFTLWYNYSTHRFNWGDYDNPKTGSQCDYYSNENRIINFVARALNQINETEFQTSLDALQKPTGHYNNIIVERVNWDGSYFTYMSPALFINEMNTSYGLNTLNKATGAQIQYAKDKNYTVWGISDCVNGNGDYVTRGAPPRGSNNEYNDVDDGLITPHAAAMALITSYSNESVQNFRNLKDNYSVYDNNYGFKDSVDVINNIAASKFLLLDQEWIFLSLANYKGGIIWKYFYMDEGVRDAHCEMYECS